MIPGRWRDGLAVVLGNACAAAAGAPEAPGCEQVLRVAAVLYEELAPGGDLLVGHEHHALLGLIIRVGHVVTVVTRVIEPRSDEEDGAPGTGKKSMRTKKDEDQFLLRLTSPKLLLLLLPK